MRRRTTILGLRNSHLDARNAQLREEISAATADAPLVMGEPVRVISLTPDSEAARAVSMGQTGIVADISGTEVLVEFADNKFPFDRDQIARVSTARSSAPQR